MVIILQLFTHYQMYIAIPYWNYKRLSQLRIPLNIYKLHTLRLLSIQHFAQTNEIKNKS